MIRIDRLDHLVLTVDDMARTCAFYRDVLGMDVRSHDQRFALHFGNQKINLHQRGREFEPKASSPTPGSGDLCFIVAVALEQVMEALAQRGVGLVEGPAARVGATGPLRSVYIRDPDGNLVELAELAPA